VVIEAQLSADHLSGHLGDHPAFTEMIEQALLGL
jgi:hypothetical protein